MKGSLNVIPGAELAQTIKQVLLPVAGMLIFIGLWHLAAPQLNTSMGTFPGPAQVWEQGGQLWQEHTLQKQQAAKYSGSPTFPDQVTTSLMTVIAGFLLATTIAVPLGILLGLNQSLLAAVNPLIQIFRPVSPLAWLPLVTMVVSAFYVSDDPMFEASFLTSVITVILCSLWPTLINTGAGVDVAFDTPRGAFVALQGVNLKIEAGEFISLTGHSGCGKSTILSLVAGLLQASKGGCILNGCEINSPGPERAVVFQNHALMPWLTVYENVELAVQQVFRKSMTRQARRDWIFHNLKLVSMTHAADKRPGEISGGMAQRVGITRALDALTRAHLQDALMDIQQALNTTVIMITHDVDEAVLLSDRIIMMTNGPAATIGEDLHINLQRPRNRVSLAGDLTYVRHRQAVLRFLHERQGQQGGIPAGQPAPATGEAEMCQ